MPSKGKRPEATGSGPKRLRSAWDLETWLIAADLTLCQDTTVPQRPRTRPSLSSGDCASADTRLSNSKCGTDWNEGSQHWAGMPPMLGVVFEIQRVKQTSVRRPGDESRPSAG